MRHTIILNLWETKEWHRSRDIINDKILAEAVKISVRDNVAVDIIGNDGYVLETVERAN